jgi:hypothetical protein
VLRTAIIVLAVVGGGYVAFIIGRHYWVQRESWGPERMRAEQTMLFLIAPGSAIVCGLLAAALTARRS